jgi:hypothetical protein
MLAVKVGVSRGDSKDYIQMTFAIALCPLLDGESSEEDQTPSCDQYY